jgi:hypothetical protein
VIITSRFIFWVVLMVALGSTTEVMARTMLPYQKATIRLLDKATARVEQADIELNQAYHFGALQVELRSCQQAPAEEEPESAAFLVVTSPSTEAAQPSLLFRGWMFASNPALSAMEHPLYDVWVLACKDPITPPLAANAPAVGATIGVAGASPAGAPVAPSVPAFVPTVTPSSQPPAIAPRAPPPTAPLPAIQTPPL